jgi:DNA-3-methyladenine glycosylase II
MSIEAVNHLRRCDPRFVDWIDRIGMLQLPAVEVGEPYIALLEIIAHQQLAGAAARSIWKRVTGLFENGVPCSKRLVEMSDDQLRSAGLSRSKAAAMRAICGRVNAGTILTAPSIEQMSDEAIYSQLTEIRGVGSWTVDMLMMFTLVRADVMPSTDYGVRKGFQILYRKRSLPTPAYVLKHTEKWRPHRSVAALYLWKIAEASMAKKKKITS